MKTKHLSSTALILALALFAQVSFGASFAERDGMVVIEAEHYDNLRADTVSGVTWELRNDVDDFLEGPTSNGEYMYVPANSNDDNFSNFDQVVIDEAPRVDYEAYFVTGGTYYIWILGNENPGNSYHFGIDGTITGVRPQGYGDWVWWNDDRDVDPVTQLDIAPGVHTINLYQREDRSGVDKIILTTNPDFIPEGFGPDETEGNGAVVVNPANGATGVEVPSVTLSWKAGSDPSDPNAPNPNIVEHYLWVSIGFSSVDVIPANPWDETLYPGTQQFTIPADGDSDGNVDATASQVIGGLEKDKVYVWVVDEGLTGSSGPLETDPAKIIWGNWWLFETVTSGPAVDAGGSIVTWLKGGTTTVDLNGTVTDATNDVTGIQWSILASPFGSAVSISNTSAAATTATLDTLGRYVLQLYAVDATQQEDSEMIEIQVYADSCEAAKNHPDGYTAPAYDFNDDCAVNFIDFAMFAMAWLEDAALTDDARYDAETIFMPPFVQFTSPLNGTTVSGDVVINAISYDEAVGTTDGDGMSGAGVIYFDVFNSSGTEVIGWTENTAPFERTWNTADLDAGTSLPVYPNGVYTIRVTALSDAGYETIKEISVTVNNP